MTTIASQFQVLWHFDSEEDRVVREEHIIVPQEIRTILRVHTQEVHSYQIPMIERRGTLHVVFCPAHCSKENKYMNIFLQDSGISWNECIYGNAVLLFSKWSQMQGSQQTYSSVPFTHAHQMIEYVKQYKDVTALKSRSYNTEFTLPEVPHEPLRVQQQVPVSSFRSTVHCPSSRSATSSRLAIEEPNLFLLKLAVKGLLAEKATCPITLEPLSESKEVFMFPCGHACSPQTVELKECPVCRAKTKYIRIAL